MPSEQFLVPADLANAERSYGARQFVGGMAGDFSVAATVLYVVKVDLGDSGPAQS